MALANRKHTRRIFKKTGSDSLKMADDKIARISQSFASNVHIDAPETPDAAQAMIYALQGIEEDVEELHRYLKSPTLVTTNITASGNISSSGTITTSDLTVNTLSNTNPILGGFFDDNDRFFEIRSKGGVGINHYSGIKLKHATEGFGFTVQSQDGIDSIHGLNILRHTSNDVGGTSALLINRDTDAIGILNTSPTASLDITGDLRVSTNITASGNISASGGIIGDLTGNASTATALTAGDKTLNGEFTIQGSNSLQAPSVRTHLIYAIPGNTDDLRIHSNGSMQFTLDDDTNETNQSFVFRNHLGMGNYDDMLTLDELGNFTLYGATMGDPHIKLQQDSNATTAGPPILEFYRSSANLDNSPIGSIHFKAKDSTGGDTLYAEIQGICEESGNGTEGGKLEFKIASHDGEMVTGLKIEDGDAEDEVDVTIGNGSASSVLIPGVLSAMAPAYFASAPQFSAGLHVGNQDTTLTRTAAGEVSIEGKKIVTENYVKHVLNCGWYGNYTSRMYLPFGYGGTFESTSPNNYLEYGAFIAPCNGTVDFVAIRSEEACGNSNVGIHIAPNGTEMPSFNPGTYLSPTVNMSVDDTSYKFDSFTDQGGSSPSFNAGDVIVVSFDPTNVSNDTVATMVLNLDWTNTL